MHMRSKEFEGIQMGSGSCLCTSHVQYNFTGVGQNDHLIIFKRDSWVKVSTIHLASDGPPDTDMH